MSGSVRIAIGHGRWRWFGRRAMYTCECGCTYRAGRWGWKVVTRPSTWDEPVYMRPLPYPPEPRTLELPIVFRDRVAPEGAEGVDGDALEARVPMLNPWDGVAVMALHSHTADEVCDSSCSVYSRHADVDTP